ncbi:MAG: AAA family ATPase [Desulfuromonas sp.]|uniref:AAA family ATPase n=1 Tax=Desulfuromonas sp. TaxID=892 RepID=UPI000CC6FC1D|nr:AAA family ATPase [Desulfuromonas sp.]PLX86151.1 MAG: AAA family ATPase [Desulfuromonas sp.]
MYCDYFGFQEKPFNLTPNPRFIFLSQQHKEGFAHLLYGIRNRSGFIEIIGEVGTGKTTILRTLLNELDDDAYRLALIFNPSRSGPELLRSINREFGVSCQGPDETDHLEALNDFLLEENAAGRTVVLVIDEAQNLKPEVLEQVRLVSNLETEKDKLIQIILVGQPELGTMLERPELRQLSQRITVRYKLGPMDFQDTRTYVEHRLRVAGGNPSLISTGALKRVYRFSGGLPRLINVLCDRALLVAYTKEEKSISRAIVCEALKELRRDKKGTSGGRALITALVSALLVAGGLFLFWDKPSSRVVSTATASGQNPAPVPPPATEAAPSPRPVAQQPALEPAAVLQPDSAIEILRENLRAMEEKSSAVASFNGLAQLWKVREIADRKELELAKGLRAAAGKRRLRLASFQGGLDDLLRLDSPALLELTLPGTVGSRYLALSREAEGGWGIAPALAGRDVLTRGELETLWFGRALLPWKNFSDLPVITRPGTRGKGVARLQGFLGGLGYLQEKPSGVFDAATIAAVTRFQADRGVAQDGRVGPHTLMLLYQEDPRFDPPRLRSGMGEEGGVL